MAAKRKMLAARAMFPCEVDGQTVVVPQGARFPADSPVVKGREALFEQAAVAPGENRGARR